MTPPPSRPEPPPGSAGDDPTVWDRDVFAAVDQAVANSKDEHGPSLIPIAPIPFGKYALVAQLGLAGTAHLLLAVARGDGGFRKLVVVKRLRPIFATEPERVTDFFAEARLGARVQHPNIVQTLESGTLHGHPFMVMEHLEGQSLDRLLRRRHRSGKPPPTPLTCFVAHQMLSGLEHVHNLNDFDGKPLRLVLRDVSPGNVMLTYGGEIKLLNFGVSAPVAGSSATSPSWQQGKFSYFAPEQVEGLADPRTDLFAVGVVLWEALTGKRLFSAPNPAETLLRVQRCEVPPIGRPDLPVALTKLVERALARHPGQRWQTASEFRGALADVAEANHWHFTRDDLADFMDEEFADLRDHYGETLRQCVCDGMEELALQSSPPVATSQSSGGGDRGAAEGSRASWNRSVSSRPPSNRKLSLPKVDARFLSLALAIGIPLWLIAVALLLQVLR